MAHSMLAAKPLKLVFEEELEISFFGFDLHPATLEMLVDGDAREMSAWTTLNVLVKNITSFRH